MTVRKKIQHHTAHPSRVADAPVKRKGARSRAEIPPGVLAALNAGTEETITLVECLAIDMGVLLSNVMRGPGLEREHEAMTPALQTLAGLGVMQRMHTMGMALHGMMATMPARRRAAVFESFASHQADTVREWAAVAATADPALSLEECLKRSRRFAADGHMGVREIAWWAVRPRVSTEIHQAVDLLGAFVVDEDANVRRFASELTRPRGVWCKSIMPLRENPALGLPLIEALRDDTSRYVQNSVGNWLNDASKDQPAWVKDVCRRWLKESPTDRTRWIVSRARRTMERLRA